MLTIKLAEVQEAFGIEGKPDEAVLDILTTRVQLTPRERQSLIARGPAATATLLGIVYAKCSKRDEDAHAVIARNALQIMGGMGDTRVIEPLLAFLPRTFKRFHLQREVVVTLADFGEAALEKVLDLLQSSDDPQLRMPLYEFLAVSRIRQERVYELLVGWARESPLAGPVLLGDYGDPRAIEVLDQLFEEVDIAAQPDHFQAAMALYSIETALRALGRPLSTEQRARYQALGPQYQPLDGQSLSERVIELGEQESDRGAGRAHGPSEKQRKRARKVQNKRKRAARRKNRH